VRLTGEARRSLDALPAKVYFAVVEFLGGSLADNPLRAGHALQRDLAGLHSAWRSEYRVVYEVREDEREVVVHRVQHRRDVYRPTA
jgi:mRNA-degrading endonuclease RelE of RelBE toxin-antitoxin system